MRKISISFMAICVLLVGTFSAAYATVGGEDIVPINENDKLLQECLKEYWEMIPPPDDTASPQWGAGSKTESNPGTHGFIVTQALTIATASNSKISFSADLKKSMIKGSFQPDIDSAANLWKDHFYCTDGNGLSGYPTSAYDQFRAHYNGAVTNYKNGNKTAALNRLGQALHYISDINEPHHAAGIAAGVTGRHEQYEKWVESNYSSYKVSSMTSTALTQYKNNTLLTIANNAATNARKYITQAKSSTVSDMQTATNATLKAAQKDAAGVIYKFASDVGII